MRFAQSHVRPARRLGRTEYGNTQWSLIPRHCLREVFFGHLSHQKPVGQAGLSVNGFDHPCPAIVRGLFVCRRFAADRPWLSAEALRTKSYLGKQFQ